MNHTRGVTVTALHVGYMDTAMVAAIEADAIEVLADGLAQGAKAALSHNRGTAHPPLITNGARQARP